MERENIDKLYELIRKIPATSRNKKQIDEIIQNENNEDHVVITIAREYGSGGRYIGKLVAKKLGIKLYDKSFVNELSNITGLSEEYIENNEQKMETLSMLNSGYYFGLNNADELFLKESELIKDVAKKESCVIVGRCANFVLKDRKDITTVFIYSNMEDKIKRATTFYGLNKENAKKENKNLVADCSYAKIVLERNKEK